MGDGGKGPELLCTFSNKAVISFEIIHNWLIPVTYGRIIFPEGSIRVAL